MITPSFSLTACERVLPRLALDFTTAVLDSRVTVTRATSATNPATYSNSSGFITAATNNQPRFDYNPSTKICRGLLIEESRANLLTQTENFSGDPPWFKVDVSVSSGAAPSPDGGNNATKLRASATTNYHGILQFYSTAAGVQYTQTVFASKGEYNFLVLGLSFSGGGSQNIAWFNLNTGTIGTKTAVDATTIEDWGNGIYRCSVTYTSAGTEYPWIAVSNADGVRSFAGAVGGTSGIYIYGAQLELGAFATSYIPTTTTSLTRNADVVTMTGTNFTDWYASSSAALAAVVIPNTATGTRPIWQLDDTTANEIIALRGNVANPELYIVDNGTPQAQLDAGTITATTQYGLCAAFTANSCAVSQNGATPVTTATATMPTVTQARIGSDGSNFLNGAVRTLRYWPQRILNAEAQAFSKV
jgi:hypothetical protein